MTMLNEKIDQLIENEDYSPIKDSYKKSVTKTVLENQIKFQQQMNESADSTTQTGGVSNWDPVLVKMVRRSMPQLMAFDLAGVQPMNGPTGSIFAMRARYTDQNGAEALYNEANSAFSGAGSQAGDTSGFAADAFGSGDPSDDTDYGTGMDLSTSEALGVPIV